MPKTEYQTWHFLLVYFTNAISLCNRIAPFPITADLISNLNFTESQIGLAMTYFFMPYVFTAIIFGILGDRYSRKKLICMDLLAEASALFICAGCKEFYFFAIGRVLLGVFQACYNTLGPTLVADMYVDTSKRTRMVGIYATSVLFGTALAFVFSPAVTSIFGFRAVFYIGSAIDLALFGLFLIMPEYDRGQGERAHLHVDDLTASKVQNEVQEKKSTKMSSKSISADIIYLFKIKTYVIIAISFATTAGVTETGITFLTELIRRQFVIIGKNAACVNDFYKFVNFTCEKAVDKLELELVAQNSNQQNETLDVDCQKCTSDLASVIIGTCGLFGGMGGIMPQCTETA